MKSNRFTLLTMAVPLIVCLLLLVALCVPASARYAYVAMARDSSGNITAQFATVGFAASSGNHITAAQSGWASSGAGPYAGFGIVGAGYQYTGANGAYFSGGTTPQKTATWTFNVPTDIANSGYYDVYEAHATQPGTDATPPSWTITNAGANYVNTTTPPGLPSNIWNKLTPTPLQFNCGQSYTVTVGTPTVPTGWRQNVDSVAWVFVSSNAPTNLIATTVGSPATAIKLDWTAPTAPASYTIQRKDWSDGTYADLTTVVGSPPATTYTDNNTVTDVEYYYRVKSTDAGGVVSGWSNEVHLFRAIATVPARKATNPSPVDTATLVQTNSVLSWTAAPAATSHDVYFGTNSAALTKVSAAQAGTTYAPVGMAPTTTYYWRIDERNSFGAGAAGDVWSYTTSAAPGPATGPNPADGATLVHTDLTDATIPGSLSWTAGAGVVSHDVYFGTVNPPVTKVSAAQAGTSYAPGTLLANTNYYWRIDEINSVGTTTGPVWTFKTGISLTVVPIRGDTRGTINMYCIGLDCATNIGRLWNTTDWHPAGDVVSLGATPTAPYTAVTWALNADGSSPLPTSIYAGPPVSMETYNYAIPNTNTTVYAIFAGTHYTVNGVADPVAGGTVTITDQTWPSATNTQFETGDIAHLVATPAAGYIFAGWVSDKAGAFGNVFAANTTYAMTPDATTNVTAYFTHAVANIVASGTRAISADGLAGAVQDWWTTQINIGAYSPTNNQLWCRPLVQFTDWAGFSTIPALSLRNGLGKLTAVHTVSSSYSSSLTLNVSAFPITTPWVYSTNAVGAWWNTTDGTIPWTTRGGDMGAELGTAQAFVGVPAADTTKTWTLPTGVDYRALLTNGVEFKGDTEGDLNYRKGFGKTSALAFFYDPPSGAANVIRDWAYLGFYAQGVAADDQLRIDTDQVTGTYGGVPVNQTQLAPKTGTSYGTTYGTYAWAVGSSATDLVDLLGVGFYNNTGKINGVTYCAVYVNNSGAAVWPAYVGLGSDDYSKVWTNGVVRGTRAVAGGVTADGSFIGPFTLLAGWNRLLVKVENGAGAHGVYARLANADRTAIAGLTYATTDATLPTNPTSATVTGTWNVPIFTFVGQADTPSGVRGYWLYFGTDPAGVPNVWEEGAAYYTPAALAPGTYYLRVKAVDYALNEATTVAAVATYVAASPHVASYGLTNKAVLASVTGAAVAAGKKFTVWGWVTVIDANSFTVDDGSGSPVKILKTSHGFTAADYVSATGTLNVGVSPPELTALTTKKQN